MIKQIGVWILLALWLNACVAITPKQVEKPADPAVAIQEQVQKAAQALAHMQQQMRALEQRPQKIVDIQPVMPAYDPLQDRMVSFAMVDEPIQQVLYALARAVGMNIILDPAVKEQNHTLTLNFEKVSAAKVLREILHSFDLYYEIQDNVIRIQPFQEKIYSLNFLNTEVNSEFTVGGDVLGVNQDSSAGSLSGTFTLSGRSANKTNAYDVLEENVNKLKSGSGKFALNRIAGSLYVKDTPAVIRSVDRMVNRFKEMLSRQILIEARIIEVSLSDEHRYGINWGAIREEAANYTQTTLTGWSLGQGIILQHQDGEFAMESMVNALDAFGDTKVISNPSIRSKHSQPAVISVGTSYTYKKSIETTRTTSGSSEEITTQVEVSTVFDGLILGVIPFIEENGTVSLLINPIKSDVDRESLQLESIGNTDSGLSIALPRVLIKEISTTISLRDNEVAILGGLIDKREVVQDDSVPGLSKVPLLGYLFKNEYKTEEIRELVIILSVSLV